MQGFLLQLDKQLDNRRSRPRAEPGKCWALGRVCHLEMCGILKDGKKVTFASYVYTGAL